MTIDCRTTQPSPRRPSAGGSIGKKRVKRLPGDDAIATMTAGECDPRQPPCERAARAAPTPITAFVKLVPNELLVEVDEFETADTALRGEMTITISLSDADGGTDVLGVHVLGRLPHPVQPSPRPSSFALA